MAETTAFHQRDSLHLRTTQNCCASLKHQVVWAGCQNVINCFHGDLG
ncbi:hypothetical protein APT_00197 [Acetobacter pasteurianus NBRC 101655]|nr:hypothetical protein APT_00197 [Acetobacter pasteurianus NBRC 101655]CCT59778.1 hypothetical protein APA386B_1706 [Acetobacter pasteurianus 386B]